MKVRKTVDLTSGSLLGKLIVFTIPIMLSGMLQLLFNAVDMIVVGRFCGSSSLAAVGSTGAITNLIVGLFMGLSSGSGIMISRAVGANQKKEIDRVLHTSVLSSIIIGICLGIIGFILANPLLQLMNTPDDVIDKATLYMRIIFIGMPVNMLYNFCASMLRSTGDSIRPLIYLVIAGLTNVVLNVMLVTIVRLDVAGVAIGTVISQGVSALLIMLQLAKGTEHLKLKRRKMHISTPHLKKIMKIGVPVGIQSTMSSVSLTIMQSAVNSFGTIAIAGNSASANIEGFLYTAMNSFSHATTTAVGQNMGACKHSRIVRSTVICLVFAVSIGAFLGLLASAFAPKLLSIYCPGDTAAIATGQIRLTIIGSFYFLCGAMEVLLGAILGLGYSLTSTIIAILGVCGLRIVWIYTIFARFHTLQTLYYSYPVAWILVALANATMLIIYMKRLKKTLNTTKFQ